MSRSLQAMRPIHLKSMELAQTNSDTSNTAVWDPNNYGSSQKEIGAIAPKANLQNFEQSLSSNQA